MAEQYDAGSCPGELVAKDMIAVRVGLGLPMAIIGAPAFLLRRAQEAAAASGSDKSQLHPTLACPLAAATSEPKNSRRLRVNSTCASRVNYSPSIALARC
jgi:hypothetical protein